MPSKETRDLVERANRLAADLSVSESAAHAEFDEALARLQRITGSPVREAGSRFEKQVYEVLTAHRDWVVSTQPQRPGAPYSPDFLVTTPAETILVEANASPRLTRPLLDRLEADLSAALPSFHANRAVIVLPDGEHIEAGAPTVEIMTLSKLRAA